jgi:phage-related protein
MGKAAAGVVTFVSSGTGLTAFSALVQSGSTAMSNLVAGVAALVPGIISVGAAAGPVLEQMTASINAAATAWSEKMVAGFASGDLTAKFQGIADSARNIWAVFQDLGGIVSGVWSAMAAGAGGVAGALAGGLSSLNAWVNSGPGMSMLTGFFTQMYGAVQAILPVLGQVGQIILGTVAPAIAQFIQAIGPGLSAVVGSLGSALASIAPAIGPLGAVLGQILTAIAPMAPAIAAVVAGFMGFSKFMPIISMLGGLLSGLTWPITAIVAGVGLLIAAFTQVPGAMGQLQAAFGQVMAAIQPLFGVLMQVGQTIMAALMPAFQALVPVVIQIVQLAAQIIAALMPIVTTILQLAASIISALMPVITALMPVISALVAVLSGIVSALAPILQIIAQVIAFFAQLLATIVGFVATALGMIISFVAGVIGGFVNMVGTVIGTVAGWVSSVIGFFVNLASQAISKAQELWGRVTGAFSEGVSKAISFVSELPGKAVSALGNVGSLLVDSGRALIQGFINGIKGMFSAVTDTVSGLVSKVRGFFPFSPAKYGAFSGHGWVLYSGRSIGEAFAQGIQDRAGLAADATKGMMSAASRNLNGYRADLGIGAAGGVGAGPRADYSVHIGTIVAADERKPIRDAEQLQLKAKIKGGMA